MQKTHYDWQRYCLKFGDTEKHISRNTGLLFGENTFKNIIPLEKIFKNPAPFTIFLGNAGSGKTTALKTIQEYLKTQQKENLQIHFFDFFAIENKQELKEKMEACVSGKDEKNEFHIFLDSLDEGVERIKSIHSFLPEVLKNLKEKKESISFHCYLACRSTFFSSTLQKTLEENLETESIEKYALLPLTEKNVEMALKTEFPMKYAEIMEKLFALKMPIGTPNVFLKFLEAYKREGQFPKTQEEAIEKDLEYHLQEHSQETLDSSSRKKLGINTLKDIARKIAVALTFAKKEAIWMGEKNKCPKNALWKEEMEIGVDEIEACIRTELFQEEGIGFLKFSHRTLQEYCTAKYLVERKISIEQFEELFSEKDEGGKYFPTLFENTIFWILHLKPAFIPHFLEYEPVHWLLFQDKNDLGELEKQLFQKLFRRYNQKGVYLEEGTEENFYKVEHSGIFEDMRKKFHSKKLEEEGISFLLSLLDCFKKEKEFENEIYTIVETSQDVNIREKAMRLMVKILEQGNPETTTVDLVKTFLDFDEQRDELKGLALHFLYPQYISEEKVLSVLEKTPLPQQFFGAYNNFLTNWGDKIPENKVGVVLKTIHEIFGEQEESLHRDTSIGKSYEKSILKRAFELLHLPEIQEEVSQYIGEYAYSTITTEEVKELWHLPENKKYRVKILKKIAQNPEWNEYPLHCDFLPQNAKKTETLLQKNTSSDVFVSAKEKFLSKKEQKQNSLFQSYSVDYPAFLDAVKKLFENNDASFLLAFCSEKKDTNLYAIIQNAFSKEFLSENSLHYEEWITLLYNAYSSTERTIFIENLWRNFLHNPSVRFLQTAISLWKYFSWEKIFGFIKTHPEMGDELFQKLFFHQFKNFEHFEDFQLLEVFQFLHSRYINPAVDFLGSGTMPRPFEEIKKAIIEYLSRHSKEKETFEKVKKLQKEYGEKIIPSYLVKDSKKLSINQFFPKRTLNEVNAILEKEEPRLTNEENILSYKNIEIHYGDSKRANVKMILVNKEPLRHKKITEGDKRALAILVEKKGDIIAIDMILEAIKNENEVDSLTSKHEEVHRTVYRLRTFANVEIQNKKGIGYFL